MSPQGKTGAGDDASKKPTRRTTTASKASAAKQYDPLAGPKTMTSIKLLSSVHDEAYGIVLNILERGSAIDNIDSISAFLIHGAHEYLKKLRRSHNNGEPFPQFTGRLPKGITQLDGDTHQQTINVPETLLREIRGFLFRSITERRTTGEYLGEIGSLVDFWSHATDEKVISWTRKHGQPDKTGRRTLRSGRPPLQKKTE